MNYFFFKIQEKKIFLYKSYNNIPLCHKSKKKSNKYPIQTSNILKKKI